MNLNEPMTSEVKQEKAQNTSALPLLYMNSIPEWVRIPNFDRIPNTEYIRDLKIHRIPNTEYIRVLKMDRIRIPNSAIRSQLFE